MKKISLTTMILLALVLGMIIGVVLNNTASPEIAKLYAQEISIFTTIFLRLIKMIIAPLVVSTLVVGIAKEGANKRGNSSRLTQSFHFFMFEPIFSPVNALNQPI
ncbi:cation:dicarboxylase symporter family transporter [Escherichia coli]|nr:cation:dicarboxylase symporter family transporter [Escherichia coli]